MRTGGQRDRRTEGHEDRRTEGQENTRTGRQGDKGTGFTPFFSFRIPQALSAAIILPQYFTNEEK